MFSISCSEFGVLGTLMIGYCYFRIDNPYSLLIINAICIVSMYATYRKFSYWSRIGVPGPGLLPFCGDLKAAWDGYWLDLHSRNELWVKTFGKIYGFYGGEDPVLVVSDVDLVKQIFRDQDTFRNLEKDSMWIDSNNNIDYRRLRVNGTRNKHWRNLRQSMSPWFSSKHLNERMPNIHGLALNVSKPFGIVVKDGSYTTVSFSKIILPEILNFLCITMTGNGPEEFPGFDTSYVTENQASKFTIIMQTYFPIVTSALESLGSKMINTYAKIVYIRVQNSVPKLDELWTKHIRSGASDMEKNIDFLSQMATRYVRQQAKESENKEFYCPSPSEIYGQIFNVLSDVGNNMFVTLQTLFYELAKHPAIQSKCREECLRVDLKSISPTYDAFEKNLSYIFATIYENSRLNPPVYQLPRLCETENYVLGGIPVPLNSTVLIPIREIMRSEENFENPLKFDPERFMGGKPKELRKNCLYLTFGAGGRRCMGQQMAMAYLAMAVATLLTSYEFKLMSPEQKITLTSKNLRTTLAHDLMLQARLLTN